MEETVEAAPFVLAPVDRTVDIKIVNRRWKAYWLYLEGLHTQEEIGEILEVSRQQVSKDLAWIREQLRFTPTRIEDMIKEIYMRMVLTRNEIYEEAKNAENVVLKAKLYVVVADLDKKLLERFTQIRGKTDVHVDQTGKLAVDYIAETYGSEGLEHFWKWVERRTSVQRQVVEATEKPASPPS